MAKGKSGGNRMTSKAAARIQGAEAKRDGGKVAKDGFAARAQKAAEKNPKK